MTKKNNQYPIKPIDKDFSFRKFPFYWAARVTNLYTQEMEKRLKKKGLTINSWRVAMILKETGPISISEITSHAGSRMPTITKTIYKMRDMDLVSISTAEGDARVSIISITKQGLETIEEVVEQTSKLFDNAFSGLESSDVETTLNCLAKIYNNLSD